MNGIERWLWTVGGAPELWWFGSYLAAGAFAGRNAAPGYRYNGALMTLGWLVPSLLILAAFGLPLLSRMQLSWWMLLRFSFAAVAGSFAVSGAFLGGFGGSAASGTGAAFFLYGFLHLFLVALGAGAWFVRLIRTGEIRTLLLFAGQLALAGVALAFLMGCLRWAAGRGIVEASGEDKARALSRAYGESISAKFPAEWSANGKRWGKYFTLQFSAPNSILIRVETNYAEFGLLAARNESGGVVPLAVRDPERTVAAWNGAFGKALFARIHARRQWLATWDYEEGRLVWTAEIDMAGLTKKRFLEDTKEARALAQGGLAEYAPSPTWFVLGEAAEAALEERDETRQRLRFLETALRQAAQYYGQSKPKDRAADTGDESRWKATQGDLLSLAEKASGSGVRDAGALAAAVRTLMKRQTGKTFEASDRGFVLRGAMRHLELAIELFEELPQPDKVY